MMPVISLCAKTFDPLGTVLLRHVYAPSAPDASRRVTRTATLDGGCSVFDGGATVADATIQLSVNAPTAVVVAAVQRLCMLYARIILTLPGGCYDVVPESATLQSNQMKITLLVMGTL